MNRFSFRSSFAFPVLALDDVAIVLSFCSMFTVPSSSRSIASLSIGVGNSQFVFGVVLKFNGRDELMIK